MNKVNADSLSLDELLRLHNSVLGHLFKGGNPAAMTNALRHLKTFFLTVRKRWSVSMSRWSCFGRNTVMDIRMTTTAWHRSSITTIRIQRLGKSLHPLYLSIYVQAVKSFFLILPVIPWDTLTWKLVRLSNARLLLSLCLQVTTLYSLRTFTAYRNFVYAITQCQASWRRTKAACSWQS